MAEKKIFY